MIDARAFLPIDSDEKKFAMPASSRLPAIDVLRGLALFGILVVNQTAFNWGIFGTPFGGGRGASGWRNGATDAVIVWLFTGKFILIFAFLFGWGIHTQVERGGAFGARYLRRLFGLALIGVTHAALFFNGDILVAYAILGLFMLRPVRSDWPVRKLVRSALVLLAVQAAFALALAAVMLAVPAENQTDQWFADYARQRAELFRTGGFWAITTGRLSEFAWILPMMILLSGWGLVAMFRLGLAAAKTFSGTGLQAAHPLARRIVLLTLIPGLAGNAVCAVLAVTGSEPWASAMSVVQFGLFAPALTVAYLAAYALILTGPACDVVAPSLGAAGRMSLSVYVGQSLIMSLLFYGYGLGLAGTIGSATAILVCVAVYATLVGFSRLWLGAFRLGPLEWVLRSITEWRLVSFRVAQETMAGATTVPLSRDP